MSQRYAVLEWEGSYEDGDGWASVIATDLLKHLAEMLVTVPPKGYTRMIVNMEELEESRRMNKEDLPS